MRILPLAWRPGMEARLFRPCEEASPQGWETLSARPIIQMVADKPGQERAIADAGIRIRPLTTDDAADMLTLADVAKPGPVAVRTTILGSYVGVRDAADGRLLAMAGERFRLPGYVELSAICVHPASRGQGLGGSLTRYLAAQAFARGDIPFLHVFPGNPATLLPPFSMDNGAFARERGRG